MRTENQELLQRTPSLKPVGLGSQVRGERPSVQRLSNRCSMTVRGLFNIGQLHPRGSKWISTSKP